MAKAKRKSARTKGRRETPEQPFDDVLRQLLATPPQPRKARGKARK
jgi:hypothetical protein